MDKSTINDEFTEIEKEIIKRDKDRKREIIITEIKNTSYSDSDISFDSITYMNNMNNIY